MGEKWETFFSVFGYIALNLFYILLNMRVNVVSLRLRLLSNRAENTRAKFIEKRCVFYYKISSILNIKTAIHSECKL